MMISPECFYEERLMEKSKEEILKIIKKLKENIKERTYREEDPNYLPDGVMCPNNKTVISMNYQYLAKAKEAYEKAGGVYKPSEEEKRAIKFYENLNSLKKIEFETTERLMVDKKFIIEIGDKKAHIYRYDNLDNLISDREFEKEWVCSALTNRHIGYWRSNYNSSDYGYFVLDGESWELTFEYSGSKPIVFRGTNAYPYNYEYLLSDFEDWIGD